MTTKPATVQEYLDALPPDRRASLEAVRAVIRANLDADCEEGIQYGMIGYYVPHRVFPAGYHCDPKQPLPYAALGATKGHLALHLMALYNNDDETRRFAEGFAKAGKKLDMGKACVRFKKADDLALDVVADAVRRVTAAKYVARYEAMLAQPRGAAKRTKPAR